MKNNKKFLLTLALGTCLVTSNLHASGIITDEERVSAELALTKRIDNANGKLQKDYDKWWNDFNKDAGCQANVPAYLNRLADSNPEAVAWLLTGGKAGLVQMNFNSEQREHFNNARTKVFQAESNLIKTGKSMLHNMRVSSQAGEMVLNELIGKVGRLTGKIDELNSTIKNINTRLAVVEQSNTDLLEKLKKSDKEIAQLKKSDYSAHDKIHNLELELKEKTTRTDVSKIFEDKLNTLSQTYEDKLKTEREAAANKRLEDQRIADEKLATEKAEKEASMARELVLQRQNKAEVDALKEELKLNKLITATEKERDQARFEVNFYKERYSQMELEKQGMSDRIRDLEIRLLDKDKIIADLTAKLERLQMVPDHYRNL